MKKFLLPVLLVAVACITSVIYMNTAPVAWINGSPIDRRELMLYMESSRAEIISEYERKFNMEYGAGFWDKSYGGETPMQTLRTRALDELVPDKMIMLTAQQIGVADNVGYSAFLRELSKENNRREKTVAAGGVIYGPKIYSEADYYFYLIENNAMTSMHKLNESTFNLTEEDYKHFYESEKQIYYRNIDASDVLWISVEQTAGDAAVTELVKLRNELENKQVEIDEIGKMGEIGEIDSPFRKSIGGSDVINAQRISFGGADAKQQMLDNPALYETAMTMASGELSGWVEIGGSNGFLYCIGKYPGGYVSYDECRDHVVKTLLEKEYANYINELVINADIRINKLIWNYINIGKT